MRITEILDRLQNVKFTETQSRALAEILEAIKEEQVTKEHVEVVNKAKYELVKWIVGYYCQWSGRHHFEISILVFFLSASYYRLSLNLIMPS